MNLRACFPNVTITTLFLLAPCLAGEYWIGGPAETSFDVHNPSEEVIVVEVALFNSDGSAFESDMLEVAAGGTDSLLFSDPEGEVRNGWARLTSDQPFNAAIFFRIAGSGNVGVLPSEQGVKFKLFTFVGDGTDTGFAVANPSETEESTVTAKIYSAVGELQREVQETYGPGEHEALFVTQEPLLVEGDSLIEFTATQPVILLGLRTDNNLLSSTAVIRPQGTGIDPGSITTEHLANGAVTGEKIAAGAVVRSLNGLTDNLTIAAGDNVTLTPNGQTLTIAATGGGGGGGDITAVNVGDGLAGGGPTGAVSVSLAPDGVTSTHLADASVGLSELAAEVSFGRVEGSNIILGDISNSVTGDSSTVAGVLSCATVGGGCSNTVSGPGSTVGGGLANRGGGRLSTVGGGRENTASGESSTIGGGEGNTTGGDHSTVGGGFRNAASKGVSTVGGGTSNRAEAFRSTIGGGDQNVATGNYSTVPGGESNTASGQFSFAAGRRAEARCDGCFAWADSNLFSFLVDGVPNQFGIRATGGAWFVSAIDTSTGSATAGVNLASGAGSWGSLSDRESKDNLQGVDPRLVLEKLSEVPISTWNYKAQPSDIRHIGPMAQDFYAAFGVGEEERYISTVDADGVALAAIQGLYELLHEKDREMEDLRDQLEDMKAALAGLVADAGEYR